MGRGNAPEIEIHPVTGDRWPDLVDLFVRPGPRGGRPITANCWCMYWRRRGNVFGDDWGEGNKRALGEIVQDGREPGLLAYIQRVPVGWVSVGPLEDFPRIHHSPTIRPVDDKPAWSINCFYVHHGAKRRGVSRALLRAAVDYARSKGATLVEGYPDSSGGTMTYTGFEEMFQREGFREVARRSPRRSVMRRALRPGAAARARRSSAREGQ